MSKEKTAVSPDTQPTLKAALDRYCTAKIVENQQIIDDLLLQRQGVVLLPSHLSFRET